MNPRSATARRSASGKEDKMENFSIARIIRRSNIGTQVVCEYFGSLDFGNPSLEKVSKGNWLFAAQKTRKTLSISSGVESR